jgi:hypothetical protein
MWMSQKQLPKEVQTVIGKMLLASVEDELHHGGELRKGLKISNPGGRGAEVACGFQFC